MPSASKSRLTRSIDALRSPTWIARIVALVGLITVLSALSPEIRSRAHLVAELVPSGFPAAATTGAAAVGLLLLALSRALRRGKFRAWLLAAVLSLVAAALNILKGLDVEEAVLSVALFALLVSARRNFTAKPDPRSLPRLAGVVVLGPLVASVAGWIWLNLDPEDQAPGTTQLDRFLQALLGLVGIPGPVTFTSPVHAAHAATGLLVLGAAVALTALLVALQPAGGPSHLTEDDKARLRTLLDRWGGIDSLSYFALRDDRSAIFSPTGKSAVTYRVVGTVSLAAGDPIGDPEAWPGAITEWLAEAKSFGWVPAVLGASERAAEAYHRVGMDALELGDEAIVHVDEFTLEGRSMRVVRQAVSRCARAGLTVVCHRVGDLDHDRVMEMARLADQWRDGEVERGFSMALGRFGDAVDDRAVVVTATDADGQLRGLLHFVPWGGDGLSLDLMRRDRDAENGIVEQMVAGLMEAAPGLGVKHVSLNFAVFRSVFARGERLGAGPALRLWRSLLLMLSRFWQIESLYRANAKYQPEWVPRFVCFRSSADLPRVGIAGLRAEAFLVAPGWVRRFSRP
ncbi:MAG TPA: phosphatidylglycerol lysyltransferase domain-containing protein [Marmoricola sp.]|nr:phosphatidylglycerol lysyltransferase domain-containing protein [Marmoricola sp.]